MCAYNVFRSRASDQFCLVPEDRPVPPFLSGNVWEFTGRVPDQARTLPRATEVAVRCNGFYIFRPFERPKEMTNFGSV
jgi:hypothetical protein